MNLENFRGKLLFPLAVALAVNGISANAQGFSSDANPTTIGDIYVRLGDVATGGCWTNLREVREYAEEKLRSKGYRLATESTPSGYELHIWVGAMRLSDGGCSYSVTTEVKTQNIQNGVWGFHFVGEHTKFGYNPQNVNNVVVTTVQEMVDAM